MNADDADAIDFMEIASHLGYLGYTCEGRLKSAARGGRKVQRWGWVESTLG
jgi:hypothetical protein